MATLKAQGVPLKSITTQTTTPLNAAPLPEGAGSTRINASKGADRRGTSDVSGTGSHKRGRQKAPIYGQVLDIIVPNMKNHKYYNEY